MSGAQSHVPSVSRGIVNHHCPRTSWTSWCHGTPRTSRNPRSVCYLAVFPICSRMDATDSSHSCSNPDTKGRNYGKRGRRTPGSLCSRQSSQCSLHFHISRGPEWIVLLSYSHTVNRERRGLLYMIYTQCKYAPLLCKHAPVNGSYLKDLRKCRKRQPCQPAGPLPVRGP